MSVSKEKAHVIRRLLDVLRRMGRIGTSRLLAWILAHRVGVRSITWFVLSLVAFALATYFTHKIAFVSRAVDASEPPLGTPGVLETDPKGWYFFSVYAAPETNGRAEMNFDNAVDVKDSSVVSFRLPQGTEMVRIRKLISSWGCHYVEAEAKEWPPVGKPLQAIQEEGEYSRIDVSGLTLDENHRLDCDVEPHSLQETFTTTVSAFHNGSGISDEPVKSSKGYELVPLPIDITVNNRLGLAEPFAGTYQSQEGALSVKPSNSVFFRFHSVRLEERRDWYLVIIGAFVAFGAALVLESIRPYIERVGER